MKQRRPESHLHADSAQPDAEAGPPEAGPPEAGSLEAGSLEAAPPVDLTALDPARDELRWERMVQSVATRAVVERRRRLTVSHQLRSWARPVLTLAVAAAAASWLLAMTHPTPVNSAATPSTEKPADALVRWATTDELPPTTNVLNLLGGPDAVQ